MFNVHNTEGVVEDINLGMSFGEVGGFEGGVRWVAKLSDCEDEDGILGSEGGS